MNSKKVNIDRRTYELDNKGAKALEDYLLALRKAVKDSDNAIDVVIDVESRISEKLGASTEGVIKAESVTKILDDIGSVNQFGSPVKVAKKRNGILIGLLILVAVLCSLGALIAIVGGIGYAFLTPFRVFESASDNMIESFDSSSEKMFENLNETFDSTTENLFDNFSEISEQNDQWFREEADNAKQEFDKDKEQMMNEFTERSDELEENFNEGMNQNSVGE